VTATARTRTSARTTSTGWLGRLRRLPDVGIVLVVYALSRLWGAALVARAATHQPPSIWTGPHASYLDMAQLWDGQWYKIIAERGYPDALPLTAGGAVAQNPWAFFPGFPYTVRPLMALGLSFSAASVLVNLVLGACAVVVVLKLVRHTAGSEVAVACAVLLCAFPSAPVLQIAYSESLALLLLALALWWLLQRRYAWCAATVVALALTRPVVAPLAVVVLAHLVVRWRGSEPFGWGERAKVVGLGLLTASSSLLWPAVVGLRVGSSDAYQRTQAAWRSGGVLQEPFAQTVGISHLLWGDDGPRWLLAILAGLLVVVLGPWARPLGVELRTWALAYPLYLAAVLEPWTSTFRYLLLAFPLLAVLARVVRSRWLVLGLAVVGLWQQAHWVDTLLVFTPPSDFPP
jgi:hypothetical protein